MREQFYPLSNIESHKTIFDEYWNLKSSGMSRRGAIRKLGNKYSIKDVKKVVEYEEFNGSRDLL